MGAVNRQSDSPILQPASVSNRPSLVSALGSKVAICGIIAGTGITTFSGTAAGMSPPLIWNDVHWSTDRSPADQFGRSVLIRGDRLLVRSLSTGGTGDAVHAYRWLGTELAHELSLTPADIGGSTMRCTAGTWVAKQDALIRTG
ncbi:MAG: hypothetical protein ACOC0P_04330 [Planctomycetota bacterium]